MCSNRYVKENSILKKKTRSLTCFYIGMLKKIDMLKKIRSLNRYVKEKSIREL